MSKGQPSVVFCREFVDSRESQWQILKDVSNKPLARLPPIITPPGLDNNLKQYLLREIRPFCPWNRGPSCSRTQQLVDTSACEWSQNEHKLHLKNSRKSRKNKKRKQMRCFVDINYHFVTFILMLSKLRFLHSFYIENNINILYRFPKIFTDFLIAISIFVIPILWLIRAVCWQLQGNLEQRGILCSFQVTYIQSRLLYVQSLPQQVSQSPAQLPRSALTIKLRYFY